jgi:hypothetical protein
VTAAELDHGRLSKRPKSIAGNRSPQ